MALAAAWKGLPRNVRGAAWMLAAAFTFTLAMSLVKYLGDDYSPTLQTFYRQAVGLIILTPLILRRGPRLFATTLPGMILLRSTTSIAAMALSFFAFQAMPLADASALSFTRVLWVVPLAALVMREQVGAWRIGAALIGFAGVLVMLGPAFQGNFQFGLPAASMLASSFLFAFTVTGMKMLTRDHSTATIMAWAAVLGTAFSFPLALLDWRWPAPEDLLLLIAMGSLMLLTQAIYTKGMTEGDAAAMAPIDYTRLVFSAVIGFFLFQELPTLWTLAGAALVAGSTLIITLRELRLAKRRPPPPDEV